MTALLPTPSLSSASQVVFVLDNLNDLATLLAALPAGAEVHQLDATGDALAQMAQLLQGRSGISAIHLFSHGSPASLNLGSLTLDAANLASHADVLAGMAAALTPDADWLIYGCDVAQGAAGQAFVDALAGLTGADVAASTDLTGAATLGGNWVLEASTGAIEANVAVSPAGMASYGALLLDPVIGTHADQTVLEDTSYSFSGFAATYAGPTSFLEATVALVGSVGGRLVDGAFSTTTSITVQGSLAEINAFLNRLVFQNAANYNGPATISVEVKAYENGYVAASTGTSTDSFDISITSVNDAPAGVNQTVSLAEDGSYTFVAADFALTDASDISVALPAGNALSAVRISSLPLHGTLALSSVAVTVGQVVSVADITAGLLVFTPVANANGTGYGNFSFQVQDDGGTDNTGINLDPTANSMTVNVTAVNDAPTTVDATVSVQKNGSQTLTLTGADVDGAGDITQYKIVAISDLHGTLTRSGGLAVAAGDVITRAEATNMTYTPTSNYSGSASFTFQALDQSGASSNTSTAAITVSQVNMVPVVTVPTAQTVTEDTAQAISGISLADSDDAGGTLERVTLSAGQGSLSLVSTTGVTVSAGALGSHSVTLEGTVANLNAALAGSNLLYTPDANVTGADTITVLANDQASGLVGALAATASRTISVTITEVPDAPTMGVPAALDLAAVLEDNTEPAGATVASLMAGHFSDVDGNTLAGLAISAYTVNALQGEWQYSVNGGASWRAVGVVSASAALLLDANAQLRFLPELNWNGTPTALTVYAIDNSGTNGDNVPRTYSSGSTRVTTDVASGGTDISATGASLGTSITAVDDASVLAVDAQTVLEDNTATGNVLSNDTDVDNTLTVASFLVEGSATVYSAGASATMAGKGVFTMAASGAYTFTPVANWNGTVPVVTYTVNTGVSTTLALDVSPVNDVPVIYAPGDTPPGGTLLVANVAKFGGSLTFSTAQIQVVDPDNTDAQLVFKLASLPTHGELTVGGRPVAVGTVFSYANLGTLVYTNDGNPNENDSFSVTLRDGAGGFVSVPAVINLHVGPYNVAPVGVGSLSSTIYEDPEVSSGSNPGKLVSEMTGYTFTDPDSGDATRPTPSLAGVVVISNPRNAAEGSWQYSSDGSTWSDIGIVDDIGGGLVLSATTHVRFSPVGNYNGSPTGLTVRALDNTYDGGFSVSGGALVTLGVPWNGLSTPISSNINTLGITVLAVDDDPTLAWHNATLFQLAGSPTELTISSSMLRVFDVDSPDAALTYTLRSVAAYGTVSKYAGSAWTALAVGSTFTQADINSGFLKYTFTGGSSTDLFTFSVLDGATRILPTSRLGGIYDTGTDTLSILPFNLNIVAVSSGGGGSSFVNTAPQATAGTLTLSEADQSVVLTTAFINATDADLPSDHSLDSSLLYTLLSVPTSGFLYLNGVLLGTNAWNRSFTQADVAAGRVTFSHKGFEDFVDEFTFNVTDGMATTVTKTAAIDVTPVNDQPTINTVASAKVLEGGFLVLDGSMVWSADVDGIGADKFTGLAAVNTLSYTVSTLPTHGEVRYADKGVAYDAANASTYTVITTGTVITKANLVDGKLYYVNDGNENISDNLTFTVNDNSGAANATATSTSVTLRIIPVNDDPVISVNTGFTGAKAIYEGETRIITVTDLMGTDPDNLTTEVQFRVTAKVSYGELLLKVDATTYTVLGVGSAFSLQDVIDGKISYSHDGLDASADSFSVTLSDGGGGNEPAATFNITVLPVNDTPTVDAGGAHSALEDEATAVTGIRIADPDSVNRDLSINQALGPFTVTLTASHGTLQVVASGGAVITGAGTSTLTITDTLGDVNATLDSLSYTSNANFAGTDSIAVLVNDGGNIGADPDSAEVKAKIPGSVGDGSTTTNETVNAPIALTVLPANDAPVNTKPGAQTVAEDAALTFSAANGNLLSVSDSIDTSMGGTDQLSVVVSVLHGTLTAVAGGGATITANSSDSVTIAGTAAQVNAALSGLAYAPTANYNGADTLTLLTSDLGNSGYGGTLTDSDTVAITVSPVNDAPVATAATLAAVDEDTAAPAGATVAVLFSGASYSDSTDTVSGGSSGTALGGIAIVGNAANASTQGVWQYNTGSAWVTIGSAGAAPTDATALLLSTTDSLRFLPNVANYNGTPGALTVRVSDATVSFATSSNISGVLTATDPWSATSTLGTSVTAVNDTPTLSITTASFAATENVAQSHNASFVLADVEASQNEGTGATQGQVQVALSNSAGSMNVTASGAAVITGNDSGSVTVTGSLADVTATLNALSYTAGDNPHTSETIAVVLSDLGNNGTGTTTAITASGSITVAVTLVNDAPVAVGTATLASVAEDAGVLTTVPNYPGAVANPAPAGATVSSLFTARFTDVDTNATGGKALAGVAITANASAADGSQGHWEYSTDTGASWTRIPTSGLSDSAALVLGVAASDLIRFNPDAANYNGTPGALTARLSDGTAFAAGTGQNIAAGIGGTGGWSNAITLVTTVTAVNDAPIIGNLNDDYVAFVEAVGVNTAGPAVLLDDVASGLTALGDIELTVRNEDTFDGATLTVCDVLGARSTDFFVLQVGGDLSISGSYTNPSGPYLKLFDNGSVVNYQGVTVATITDNSLTGNLVLTFNAAASGAAVEAILHNLAYSNNEDAFIAYTKNIGIVFTDGNSGAQGSGGNLATTAIVHITITPSNDAPVLTAGVNLSVIETDVATATTAATLLSMLGGSNFVDPDSTVAVPVTGNVLAGVAIGAFDNKGLGEWQIKIDSGAWTNLSAISGTTSASSALLLSADTQVQFLVNANANTSGLSGAALPSLSLYGVEKLVPDGASLTYAPAIAFTTDAASPLRYNTTTDTLESRVAGLPVTVDLTVAARNDAPVLTGTAASPSQVESPTINVGTVATLLLTSVTLSDLDVASTATLGTGVFGAGTITVSIASRTTGDKFSLSGTVGAVDGGSVSGVASTSGSDVASGNYVITLSNTATLAEVKAILEAIQFESTSDNPPAGARSYTITLNDGNNAQTGGNAGGPLSLDAATVLTGSITITGVNDAPTVTLTPKTTSYTENATASLLFSDANVLTDQVVHTEKIIEIKLTVSGLLDGSAEKLMVDGTEITLVNGTTATATNTGSVVVSVTAGTATVTFTKAAGITEAQANTLVNALAYRHSSEAPTAGDRVVTITSLQDDGGTVNGGTDTRTFTLASTVTVVPVNDAPDLTATVAGTYVEQTGVLLFLSSAAVSDVDTAQFNGGSLTIALGSYFTGDTLGIVAGNGITVSGSTVSYDDGASTHVIGTVSGGSAANLVISFTTTDANFAAVVALTQQIGFSSTSENPTWAGAQPTRSVTVTLNDGGNSGTGADAIDHTLVTGTLNVTGINDAPTLSALDATAVLTHVQGSAGTVIDGNAVLADLDLQALNHGVATGNWSGSTLTLARQTTASVDDVFGNSGNLASLGAATGNVVLSGTTIGSYTQTGGVLAITFNASATTAAVNETLNSITYANATTTPGALAYNSVVLQLSFNDQNSDAASSGTAGTGQNQGSEGQKSVSGLITVNIDRLPVVVADANSVNEGVATTDTTSVAGNVLTGLGNTGNLGADSDADIGSRSDVLAVVNAKDSSAGSYTAVSASTTHTDGASVVGDYGTLKIGADGSYTYIVNNALGAVQALAVGETLLDTFTYQVHDGVGGYSSTSLTLTINGTNDATQIPAAGTDTLTETNAALGATGSLTIYDADTSNVVGVSVDSVAITGVNTGLTLSDAQVKALLTVASTDTNLLQSAQLNWTFNSASENFNWLAAGEQLVFTYQVSAADGVGVTATSTVTVTITGSNDTPTITAITVAGAVVEDSSPVADNPNTVATEAGSYLTGTGSLSFADLDLSDTSLVTSAFVSATVTTGTTSVSGALSTALQDLANTFKITGAGVGAAAHSGTVNWAFALDNGLAQYLAVGEVVTVTYRVTVTDDSGITVASGSNQVNARTQDVTVTLTGANDAPVISLGSGDSAAQTLTETNAALTTSGTLSVTDVDLTNTVTAQVLSVAKSDTTTGITPDDATLKGYLSLASASILDATHTTGTISWSFNSASEAFNYLAAGEHLTLTYTVRVTDSSAATADQTVVVTINGSNDTPTITAITVAGAVVEETSPVADNPNTVATETGSYLTGTGSLSFADLDTTDTSLVTSAFVSAAVTTGGTVSGALSTALQDLVNTFKITGAGVGAAANSGTVNWAFALDNGLAQYLAVGEVVTVTYRVTVTDDSGITVASGSNEVNARTQDVTVTLTGANDAPVISLGSGDSAAATLTESNAVLTSSGTLSVTDVDLTNTVTAQVLSVAKGYTTLGITPSDATLKGYLTLASASILDATQTTGTISWSFNSASEAFNYLADGEMLRLTYVVRVTDSSSATADRNVVITITGTNDAPVISVGSGNSAAETLTETNAALTSSGTLSVADVDMSNTVTAQVLSVVKSDTTTGITPDDTALKGYLSLASASIINATQTTGTISWAFNSASEAFNYLAAGEHLTLTYTVRVTDNNISPATADQTVVITITGSNDAPVISVGSGNSAADTLTETNAALTSSGTLSVADVDLSNTVAVAVTSVVASDTASGMGSNNAALLSMLTVDAGNVIGSAATSGTIHWSFDSSNPAVDELFNYLAAGEHLTLTYGVTATDSSGGTTTQNVVITINGTNDAPVLSATPVLTLGQAEDDGVPTGAVGTLVSSLLAGVSDVDATALQGVALTGADTAHGSWYYAVDGGTSWSSFGALSEAAVLLLAPTARVYFKPVADWSGSVSAALTLRAWDQSSGSNGGTADLSGVGSTGLATAYSTATDTVALTVTAVNDQPVATLSATLPAYTEDTSPAGTVISTLGASLGYSDATDDQSGAAGANNATAFSYLAIVGSTGYTAAQGSWQVSTDAGTSWITVPASGLTTSAALVFAASAQLRFLPAANFEGTPGTLTVRLADGSASLTTSTSAANTLSLAANGGTGLTGAWSAVDRTVGTTVTPVNDAPTLSGSTALSATNEDNTSSPGTAASVAAALVYGDATDNQSGISGGADAATLQKALAIVGNAATAAQGTWQYTLDGTSWTAVSTGVDDSSAIVLDLANASHQLRFVPTANYHGTPGSLTLRAADGTWNSATGVQDIHAAIGTTAAWSASTGALGITVNSVNDGPAVLGLDATSVNAGGANPYRPGTPAPVIVIDPDMTLADQELLTENNNWNGATLTVERQVAASSDDVFGASGTAGSGVYFDTGNVLRVGGTAVGSYSQAAGTLVLTFNAAATAALVNQAVQGITYSNANAHPTYPMVTLDYTLNDRNSNITGGGTNGGGQDQGGLGLLSSTAQIVLNFNSPPVANPDAPALNEGVSTTSVSTLIGNVITGVVTGEATDTDRDLDPMVVQGVVKGVPTGVVPSGIDSVIFSAGVGSNLAGDYGTIKLEADGSYIYTLDNTLAVVQALAVGEHLTETFSYTINDGRDGADSTTLAVTINGTNDVPLITASSTDTLQLTTGNATPTLRLAIPLTGVVAGDKVRLSYMGQTQTGPVLTATDIANGYVDVPWTMSGSLQDANGSLSSVPVKWIDWTSYVDSGAMHTVNGTFTTETGTVNATLTNSAGFGFVTTSGGKNYFAPTAPFISAGVAAPTTSDMVAFSQQSDRSLAFSAPVTDLYYAYVSMNGNRYRFDRDFDIISQGTGYWGAGSAEKVTHVIGGVTYYDLNATGGEPHGVIRFKGTFSTLAWSTTVDEYWNGFTLGIKSSLSDLQNVQGEFLDSTSTTVVATAPTLQVTYDPALTGLTGSLDATVNSVLLTESDAALGATGSLTLYDVDTSNVVTVSVDSVAISGVPAGMTLSNALVKAMLTAVPTDTNLLQSAKLNWTFDSTTEHFSWLGAGQVLVFTYQLSAHDGSGGTATTPLTVTIKGLNDAPVLGSAAAVVNQVEDDPAPSGAAGTLVSSLLGAVTDLDVNDSSGVAITAADSTLGTWYYTTNGGTGWTAFTASTASALLLGVDANTRVYFKPDLNANGDANPALTLKAWDQSTGTVGGTANLTVTGSGGATAFSSASNTVTLHIQAINEAPVFYPVGGSPAAYLASAITLPTSSLNYVFNGPSVLMSNVRVYGPQALMSNLKVYDTELTGANNTVGNFDAATLTLSRSGGASVDDQFVGLNGLVLSGSSVLYAGATVGTFTQSGGQLRITFNSNATQDRVNGVLQNIGYANVADAPTGASSSVDLLWVFSDMNNHLAQGDGGVLTDSLVTTVLLNPIVGSKALTGGAGGDYLIGSALADTLNGGAGVDVLRGGNGADLYLMGATTDHTAAEITDSGASGVDEVRFIANLAFHTLTLYAGDTGIEQVVIGTGTAAAAVTSGTTALNVDASAAPNALTIIGNAGANALTGTAFADILTGSAGNDTLTGGAGTDNMNGGVGADLYLLGSPGDHAAAEIADNGTTGVDEVRFTSTAANETLTLYAGDTGIEQVVIGTGTATGAVTSGTTVLNVNASLVRNGLTLIGNAGANSLTGTGLADTLTGGAGNDTLTGLAGNDTFNVDAGSDTVTDLVTGDVLKVLWGATATANNIGTGIYAFVATALTGNAGTATLNAKATGGTIDMRLATGSLGFSLNGGGGIDTLTGSKLADTLTGGHGDTLTGLGGIDTYHATGGTVTVTDLGNGGAGVLLVDSGATANATVAAAWTATGATLNLGIANIRSNGFAVNLASASTAAGAQGFAVTNTGATAAMLTGSALADTLTGGTGADTLTGGLGIDSINGGAGSDLYLFGAAGEHMAAEIADTGATGVDQVRFTSTTVNETLTLYAGDTGIEQVVIGTGTAAAAVSSGTTALNVDASAVLNGLTIIGNAGGNRLTGTGFADILTGGAGNDTLTGGAGIDALTGGAGNDTLTGGAGNDTFNVDAGSDTVADLATGDVLKALKGATATANNIVAFVATAASSNAGTVILTTQASGGVVNMGSATGTAGYTLTGAAGNDTLVGSALADTLTGGAGADSMNGGGGSDLYLFGSAGERTAAEIADTGTTGVDQVRFTSTTANETLTLYAGDTGIEQVVIGTGTAAAAVTSGTTALNVDASAAPNGLTIIGNAGGDNLTGTRFADTLTGGAGNDTLTGGAGNDTFNVDAGSDTVTDLATGDVIKVLARATATANNIGTGIYAFVATAATSNAGTATLNALSTGGTIDMGLAIGTAGFALNGGAGIDTLTGSKLADTLSGGAGVDTLNGGAGNDRLLGGLGKDVLTGGLGSDTFVFNDLPALLTNFDTVTDFVTRTDKLEFSRTVFAALAAQTPAAGFVSGAGLVAAANAAQHLIYNSTSGMLYYDADGSGAIAAVAVALIGTSTHPALVAADLLFV